MRDLRFVGVDDEGTRLLLVDEDGQQHQVQIDDALRSAVRSPGRPRTADQAPVADNVRPRDVQAMLRSGLTIDEVAERTGWSPTKVGLFEPPIRAERDHVAITAQRLPLHTRVSGRDQTSTVGDRVAERLTHRGVESGDIEWDAYRGDRGWTIECRFPAGGRPRVATWRYDAQTQSLHPTDDEARWLSEDEQQPATAGFGRAVAPAPGVYDVVAEGGLEQTAPAARPANRPSAPKIPHARVTETFESDDDAAEQVDETTDGADAADSDKHSSPVDLVSVMRERSKARRRAGGRRKTDNSPNHPAGKAQSTPSTESDDEPGAPSADNESSAPKNIEEPAKPSVDDLGHDPVTGTADLFGLKEVEPLRREVVRPVDEPARESDQPEPDESTEASSENSADDSTDREPVADEAASEQPEVEANDDAAEDEDEDDSDDAGADRPTAASPESKPTPQTARESEPSGVPERPSQARKGRPSVPSWDDIMFGKRGPKG